VEILRQLGALSSKQEQALAGFGPVKPEESPGHCHRSVASGVWTL